MASSALTDDAPLPTPVHEAVHTALIRDAFGLITPPLTTVAQWLLLGGHLPSFDKQAFHQAIMQSVQRLLPHWPIAPEVHMQPSHRRVWEEFHGDDAARVKLLVCCFWEIAPEHQCTFTPRAMVDFCAFLLPRQAGTLDERLFLKKLTLRPLLTALSSPTDAVDLLDAAVCHTFPGTSGGAQPFQAFVSKLREGGEAYPELPPVADSWQARFLRSLDSVNTVSPSVSELDQLLHTVPWVMQWVEQQWCQRAAPPAQPWYSEWYYTSSRSLTVATLMLGAQGGRFSSFYDMALYLVKDSSMFRSVYDPKSLQVFGAEGEHILLRAKHRGTGDRHTIRVSMAAYARYALRAVCCATRRSVKAAIAQWDPEMLTQQLKLPLVVPVEVYNFPDLLPCNWDFCLLQEMCVLKLLGSMHFAVPVYSYGGFWFSQGGADEGTAVLDPIRLWQEEELGKQVVLLAHALHTLGLTGVPILRVSRQSARAQKIQVVGFSRLESIVRPNVCTEFVSEQNVVLQPPPPAQVLDSVRLCITACLMRGIDTSVLQQHLHRLIREGDALSVHDMPMSHTFLRLTDFVHTQDEYVQRLWGVLNLVNRQLPQPVFPVPLQTSLVEQALLEKKHILQTRRSIPLKARLLQDIKELKQQLAAIQEFEWRPLPFPHDLHPV